MKVGDVVSLNSGSPQMTIMSIDNNNMVEVTWMVNFTEKATATFPSACLKKEN